MPRKAWLWADGRQRTDDDESANATTLKNIASELAFGGGDDDLASRRLEGIAYGPSDRLSETFDFAQKGFQPS
jgi:hypothetical protein